MNFDNSVKALFYNPNVKLAKNFEPIAFFITPKHFSPFVYANSFMISPIEESFKALFTKYSFFARFGTKLYIII